MATRATRAGTTILNSFRMFPKAILFDLDDTLFDHQRASGIALRMMHARFAPTLLFDAFSRKHSEVLEEFHQHFLRGKYTLDQARLARMKSLFAAFELDIDDDSALRVASLYREQHQANRALVPGARELLDALHGQSRLGIVTNNSTVEQHEKLRALDIARYFDIIVISEDVGVTKPDPRIFEIALERIGARADESVFVGDSWQNDVQGAISSGLTAVWLNRNAHSETQPLAHLSGIKSPEIPANAGVSNYFSIEIHSLAPHSAVLAAIQKTFNNRTPGVHKNEQLETLAS